MKGEVAWQRPHLGPACHNRYLPYRSSKREPLGQSYVRGYKMPEGLGTKTGFGMKIDVKVRQPTTQHYIASAGTFT